MEIILGIFHTDGFRILYSEKEWLKYPFLSLPRMSMKATLVDTVKSALDKCSIINFVLDGVKLPLDNLHSYTCMELMLVINNPDFLQKTKFWVNLNEIPTPIILNLITLSTSESFSYKDTEFQLLIPKE